ncbi:MAG: hypothetical protein OES13_02595 [Acidimicrobiia bacterium]|nr:hypothetical protein [Acidimicrobiia bacterium]
MVDIPRDVADSEGVPDDLDSFDVGEYSVPSPRRRRSAGMFYFGGALVVVLAIILGLPAAFWAVVAALLAIGAYHLMSAWDLEVREGQALEIANRAVPFGVGHASAQMAFVGWRAKPVWHLLVFSDDDPPTHRGLVRVSPLTGGVIDVYTEDVPAG